MSFEFVVELPEFEDTPTEVTPFELQYELEPSKVATITYTPSACGVHKVAYFPVASVVTVPMLVAAPVESMAVSLAVTPLGVGGELSIVAFCMCRYSIHVLMLSSDTAGVLGCAGDVSRIEPSIKTADPFEATFGEAETEVAV